MTMQRAAARAGAALMPRRQRASFYYKVRCSGGQEIASLRGLPLVMIAGLRDLPTLYFLPADNRNRAAEDTAGCARNVGQ
jgi:hypothetical protein